MATALRSLGIDRADTAPWPEWEDVDRLRLYGRCGTKCFLVTSGTTEEKLKDPSSHLKFPVCRATTRTCKASASGILAARRRAILTKKYPALVASLTDVIRTEKLTKKSRRQSTPVRVRLAQTIVDPITGKRSFIVRVTYQPGVSETVGPLSSRTVQSRYGAWLSDTQLKKLY